MSGAANVPGYFDLTSPLAGRQTQQRELNNLLERCIAGYGGVVLISGEAGIGKTTLAERLVRQAGNAGARTVIGQCFNQTAGRPYAPWIDIVRSLASGSGDAANAPLFQSSTGATGPYSKEELFDRVATLVHEATASQPTVLVVEDIHWTDHASLELLRHIARQAAGRPLLLTVTFRDDEPDGSSYLPRVLPELIRESRAERLELRRLTLEDVRDFVDVDSTIDDAAKPSIARYLFERGDGNPLFINELFRDLGRDDHAVRSGVLADPGDLHGLPVPSLIRHVIENRALALNPSTRALLDTAAVIGQDVLVDLWQAVTGASEDDLAEAIEEAVGCHLLSESPEGGRVRFVHGLIQETLYHGQIALRRRARHREIASYLAAQPDPSPDLVALHFDRAGDARAIDWLVRAAEQAGRLYAAPDAIRYVDRASEIASRLSVPLPLTASRIRANAYELLGEIELAKTEYAGLLQRSRDLGDRATECQTLTDLGLLWSGHDYQRSGDYLQQALDIARTLDDRRVQARCLNRVANWQANTGHFAPAISGLEESLRIFEELDDAEGIADTLDLIGSTHYLGGNYGASAAAYDRAIQLSRQLSDPGRLVSSLANLSIIGGDCDVSFDAGVAAARDPDTWVGYGEEAVRISREIGWTSGESFSLAMLGAVVAVRGDLGRALTLLEEGHELARKLEHQQWLVATSLIVGSIWSELFDPSRARLHLERARGLARGLGSHLWSRLIDASLAVLNAENGDPARGLALLEPWTLDNETPGSHADRALRFASGRVHLAAGKAESTLATATSLLELEELPAEVAGIPQILKLKADALEAMNCAPEAGQAYADAARAAETLGYRTVHWQILRNWSVNQDRLGTTEQAAERRREAKSIVRDIAGTITMPSVRDRFQERALDLISESAQPGRQPRANPFGLSPRQLEVLTLVSQGLTDAEVAEQLFISPRTVARHLQGIYARLGVNTRAGATFVAYKHDLIS